MCHTQKQGSRGSALELTKGENLVAVRLRCGGAPVSEGQQRQPLEHHHGMGVLKDLRMGQEGVVRELLMVNCGGKIEEAVDGTYRWQNGRRLGLTRGRGSLKKRCTHGGDDSQGAGAHVWCRAPQRAPNACD
jgi:hypothetical protein